MVFTGLDFVSWVEWIDVGSHRGESCLDAFQTETHTISS